MLESKIFNCSDYESRLAFNQELMVLVAGEFIKEATDLLEQLKRFSSNEDWHNVIIVAHRLKSASCEVSGYSVHYASTTIELLAKKNQVELIPERLADLIREFEQLKAALTKEILS